MGRSRKPLIVFTIQGFESLSLRNKSVNQVVTRFALFCAKCKVGCLLIHYNTNGNFMSKLTNKSTLKNFCPMTMILIKNFLFLQSNRGSF